MVLDVLSGWKSDKGSLSMMTDMAWDFLYVMANFCGMLCLGCKNSMRCVFSRMFCLAPMHGCHPSCKDHIYSRSRFEHSFYINTVLEYRFNRSNAQLRPN